MSVECLTPVQVSLTEELKKLCTHRTFAGYRRFRLIRRHFGGNIRTELQHRRAFFLPASSLGLTQICLCKSELSMNFGVVSKEIHDLRKVNIVGASRPKHLISYTSSYHHSYRTTSAI